MATEAGIGLSETMGFSVLIIAGAAQFAALVNEVSYKFERVLPGGQPPHKKHVALEAAADDAEGAVEAQKELPAEPVDTGAESVPCPNCSASAAGSRTGWSWISSFRPTVRLPCASA